MHRDADRLLATGAHRRDLLQLAVGTEREHRDRIVAVVDREEALRAGVEHERTLAGGRAAGAAGGELAHAAQVAVRRSKACRDLIAAAGIRQRIERRHGELRTGCALHALHAVDAVRAVGSRGALRAHAAWSAILAVRDAARA